MTIKKNPGEENNVDEKYQEIHRKETYELFSNSVQLVTKYQDKRKECLPQKHWESPASEGKVTMEIGDENEGLCSLYW